MISIPQDQAIKNIPFSKLSTSGEELFHIKEAIDSGQIIGDGHYTKLCQIWLKEYLGAEKVLLTHSCTAALEMAFILADIQPGDEVIMPSYTFVSTANAVVLRGGVPVFVDIRPDTLNLDEAKLKAAITDRTKAIAPVHYAGLSCEMPTILELAHQHGLQVIEDAAQGICSKYDGKPVGSFGNTAAFSFHGTKNIVSGEGGALAVNDPSLVDRAEIIWEKGTNRSQFFRGDVDKYTWVDIGSSYLPSDILAAFLWSQLQHADTITQHRLDIWNRYHHAFERLETDQKVQRPLIPQSCQHNAHIYYLLVNSLETRSKILANLKRHGVQATFHYVPLHSAPAGRKYGRQSGELIVTEDICDRIVRLPLFADLTFEEADFIISIVQQSLI
ncbi:dTDP-4-amino-4,6-dideoxygalactose transaminase [Phormidium tenue]|uniref:dTDP-4-amino-4,6-dideoxygalactose transaminase n=1 Tax=Phormidium tenue NIES-30 TaxID=549789 RepID=A0A1U7JBA4_9CYAN|nr:dTDP-4-amino-4,6-dideoxygalactose transaminase [Phormidium tenue]MBD2230192.1 dTDP-4-amino-4,6-dideoxygalactose transaminase [Phormidium tenue FACHB-1052]OKH50980.1 dTDP-4-amino-4,6-dideoxygalactose transaminase [Phormidium tenue NIES-30]